MKEKVFIPTRTQFNSYIHMWYMDITEASLSELIELKQQLKGINDDAIIMLDGMIRDSIGYTSSESKLNRREDNSLKRNMKKRKKLLNKTKHQRR